MGFFTLYNEIFSTLSDWFVLPKKFKKKIGVSAQLSSLPLEHRICISSFMERFQQYIHKNVGTHHNCLYNALHAFLLMHHIIFKTEVTYTKVFLNYGRVELVLVVQVNDVCRHSTSGSWLHGNFVLNNYIPPDLYLYCCDI